ncbi:MAG: PilZ domain-containing protein [Gammaproteobacteria bacterium]|nr:PilZ domain-containing protein [Gammaproteobacteria bacterium]
MSENNRRHIRHEIQIDVNITFVDNSVHVMQTRDLSEGGMFIITSNENDVEFPLGEMVHLNYLNPLDDNEETDVDAIIVRIMQDGVGLAFVDLAAF